MKEVDFIANSETEFLAYLRSKFPLIHLSNVFFRDVHFGVMSYLKEHGMKLKYTSAEQVTRQVGEALERTGILKRIDHQSWLLNYPAFALPRVEKKAAAVAS